MSAELIWIQHSSSNRWKYDQAVTMSAPNSEPMGLLLAVHLYKSSSSSSSSSSGSSVAKRQ
jgi:hypothetical protein